MAKRDALVRVGADTTELNEKLTAAQKRLDTFGDLAKKAGGALVTAFAAAAASAAALTARGIALGDELAKSAQKIGITADALAGLRHAAGLSNVEAGALDTALVRLGKTVSEAHSGLASAKRAFQDLGLSIEDVRKLPLDEQMLVVGDAMNELTNHTDKLRVSQELFGRAGADLIPLFEEGSAAIREQAEEARKLGLTLDETQSKHIQAAADSMTKLKAAVDGASLQLAAEFAPDVARAGEALADFVTITARGAVEMADLTRQFFGFQKAAADMGDERLKQRMDERFREITRLNQQLQSRMSGIARVGAETRLAELREEQKADLDEVIRREKARGAAIMEAESAAKKLADAQARLNELAAEIPMPDRKLIMDQLPAEPENLKNFPQKILDAQKALSDVRLQVLRDEFATEEQLELDRYAAQLERIREVEAERGDLTAEIHTMREQAETEHEKRMQKIREKSGQSELGAMGKLANSKFAQAVSASAKILALIGTENKRAFEAAKKLALAQAAIEMPQAIMSAVARAGGLPFGAWAGALTAAEYAARISAIRRQQFDAGPSGASASVGGGMAMAPVASTVSGPAAGRGQTVIVNLNGESQSTSAVRDLLKQLNETLKDGGTLIVN